MASYLEIRDIATVDKTIRKQRISLYPLELWWFLACVIFLLGIIRVSSELYSFLRRRGHIGRDSEATQASPPSTIHYRRIPLVVVNAYRIVVFRTTIPIYGDYSLNVAEVAVAAVYTAALFLWSFINSTNLDGMKFDPQYYADRIGNIASMQLGLVVALSMKNNIISWITGIGFDKLNYLHRMAARIICVLLFAHIGGRITLHLTKDDAITFADPWMGAGIAAFSCLFLLCVVSIRPVRQTKYEAFVVTHFVFVLIILVGTLFHTRHFLGPTSANIWPPLILWAVDRLIRAIRVVVFNHSYFGLKAGHGTLDAKAEVASPGFIRLVLRRPKHFHWLPGQNAYLTMPGVSFFPFESHPFTIANADINRDNSTYVSETSDEKDAAEVVSNEEDYGKDVVFLVNARQGCTKKLLALAESGGSLKVFLDGPYGAPPRVDDYDTVVFLAGGSGVTFVNPLFADLVHRAYKGIATCKQIIFIWAMRHPDHLNSIYFDLRQTLEEVPATVSVEVRIYITGDHSVDPCAPTTTSETGESGSSSPSSQTVDDRRGEQKTSNAHKLPFTTVSSGRPDVRALLLEAASMTRGDRMSVNVCGPASLTAAVRRSLRASEVGPMSVLRGGPDINLFVESFGMA